jgi:ligand-binding sensor domain-containing protein
MDMNRTRQSSLQQTKIFAKMVALLLHLLVLLCILPCAQSQTSPSITDTSNPTKGTISLYGPTTSVRIIRQDSKGFMWLASNEGIIRYDGKAFTNITGDLSPNRFFDILEDRNGNFWFGNNGLGAFYYDGKSLRNFTTADGLVDNRVMCLYEDSKGNIWFGTLGGVSRYDGKSFQSFTTSEGLRDNGITSITEDSKGNIWFGARGGACSYDGKSFTPATNKEGKSLPDTWSIIEDKQGGIWIGGNHGLWRRDGSTFTRIDASMVNYIYEDKTGNIWTTGKNTKSKWTLSRFDNHSSSNKKSKEIEIAASLNLFGMMEANDGIIWFGSYDGVYRFDGNSIGDFKKK